MGLFGKLFEKKVCSICSGDIGLLGNRKLEDGNMCKTCAAKLSPWFSDRRNSTVAEIEEQLAYREDNKKAVAEFTITRTFGSSPQVLIDEDNEKFMVTYASNIKESNPDVLDISMVTGCELDIEEQRNEAMKEDEEGNEESYNPPRYYFSYDFNMTIRVKHPYFNEISFKLNASDVEMNPDYAVPMIRRPDPERNREYQRYEDMGKEIKEILTSLRQKQRDEAKAAAMPKTAVECPYCGATTIPDAKGCCEYCGGALS